MIFKALMLCFLVAQIVEISGHGRLLQPVSRSSAWRKFPAQFPAYYGDNQMFCGGTHTQYTVNGGKCGICGESYSGQKKFEKGGSLYRDLVVAKYSKGAKIDVEVELTANHLGYFEFKICNVDGSKSDATQQCLDKNILTDSNGKTKIFVGRKTGKMKFKINLPADLICKHCVFQWKYNTGNSWGSDPVTGKSGIGVGNQEQFYGCSDIQVGSGLSVKRREDKKELMNFDAYENILDDIVKCILKTLTQLYKFKENIGMKTETEKKTIKSNSMIW